MDEHHHADVSGGRLRPAVFGAMDGLVTNIALISGVGGAGVEPHQIVLTGIAGLVAGAISMGLGEYTSVRTQNEQVEHEVAKERRELERNPQAEADELAELWISRGLQPELAREVATALGKKLDVALRVHAQEELGIDPNETPSPWMAAILSFVCFSAGALVAWFTNRNWWSSGLRQLVLGCLAAAATYGVGRLIGATVT